MAPSRKKGASRAAAAAAAARRQWKVGDLVLAKVKGFPAWPATVSEPEKWGYAADLKKVLVYFFGTQQIAFCNPADVEAFTEEKKESLLVKRHGKGSDFVRAVHEIVESYEKLKKEQVNCQSMNEQDLISENKNTEPLTKSFSKDEAPSKASQSFRRTVCSSAAQDVNAKPEDATAVIEDDMQVIEMLSKEVSSGSMAAETGTVNTYLTRGSQAQKSSMQRLPPSSRRTRSSSRIDANKVHSLMITSGSYSKNAVCDGANALREGSARRNKRLRKSPDVDRHEVDSPDLVSNCSIEGDDSEILTADSDTLSLNEGSTVESDCKTTLPESIKELCQLDVELSQRLEFQTNAVINKKKRKPSRKRPTSDATEFAVKSNEKIGSDSDIAKIEQNMLSDRERSTERYSRDDGDEHLPLVKRARVRMGRASSIGDGPETSQDTEEKPPEGSSNVSELTHASSNKDGDRFMDQSSPLAKEKADNSSPQNACPATKPQLWEVRKNQFVGSLDGEAALPPSKRLHRALEAMSANAADDGQASPEEPPKMKSENIGCFSPSTGFSKLSMEKNSNGELLVTKTEHRNKNTSRDCSISDNTAVPDLSVSGGRISSPEVAATSCGASEQEHMIECSDGKLHLELSCNVISDNVVEVVSPNLGSPNHREEDASINYNNGSQDPVMPHDDCNTGRLETADPSAKPDDEILYLDSNHVKEINDPIHSPNNATSICMECADDRDNVTTKSCQLPQVENQDPAMVTIESGQTERGSSATSSSAPVEVLNSLLDNQNLRSDSASDGQSGEKAVSVTLSSSSLTDGLDSAARATPLTSTCNASASDNVSIQINACSPTVQSHSTAPRTAANWNTREADTSLASFDASLRTLTRTKESIGRATRVAIECSKYGIAAKVVEILAHSLEHESNLHRRVDLFFLVDSIAQCSKGLKGEVGGIYPSAILAVLPRLLTAAAPPGSSSQENRRQCLKVLRVWQERRILPESIIRHHIRELDSHCSSSCSRAFARRPLRNERSFDDPIRQMEGMLVDEYGSNSSIQLPGFQMPPMLRDEDDGIDSDGESFEAVTPEHNAEKPEGERRPISVVEKHRHILEDVDGELEMEDVAPSSEAVASTSNVVSTESQTFDHPPGSVVGVPFAPPLPQDVPPRSPPLPTSPPPPPPLTSFPLRPERLDSISNGPNSRGHTFPQGNDNFHSQGSKQAPNSANSSLSSPTVSNPNVRAVNNIPPADGTFNKGFRLRPPHPAPSNQFSYVQPDQRVQSHRDIPPSSHPNRFHVPNSENGNFYREHDRMKLAPVDIGEHWRTPPFHGPRYPDGSEMYYAPPPYAGQVCEPTFSNQRWNFQPRAMNHRELMPYRPPAGGPIPVAARGHNFWRPR